MSRDGRVLRAWLAVLLWAACVWGFGGDGFAGSDTSRFLRPLVEWVFPSLSNRDLYEVLHWIRKSAHAIEYGLLSVLLLRALWIGTRLSLAAASATTLAIVATLAVADEARQSASALRTGSGWDVALDFAGGGIALALVLALHVWLRVPLLPRTRGGST